MKVNWTPTCTLVSLPHIYYSCYRVLTDSLIGEVDLEVLTFYLLYLKHFLRSHAKPQTVTETSHSASVALHAQWHHKKCCRSTGLAQDSRWGEKAVYLKATGLQADNLMKL